MRVVLPSVDYADFLAVTLPAWRAALSADAEIIVVTAPADRDSQAVAAAHGARCCVTDAWYAGGAVFDKAAALDLAFGFEPGWTSAPAIGTPCLALDADVYPGAPVPAGALDPNTLYGVPRYACPTPADLEAISSGRRSLADLTLIPPRLKGDDYSRAWTLTPAESAARCLGYFQLFPCRPGVAFGRSHTAGGYDMRFRYHFIHRRAVAGLWVLHLGGQCRGNWRGRVVPRWGSA